MALVKVFGNRESSALEAPAPKKETRLQWSGLDRPEQDWSTSRKSTFKEDEIAAASKSLERVEAVKGVLMDKPASGIFVQMDNNIFEISHWKEALDLSMLGGHKKALVKMIELAEGTSRKETWVHALSTTAREGKEKILAMLIDHKEPSNYESPKITKAANLHRKGPNIF